MINLKELYIPRQPKGTAKRQSKSIDIFGLRTNKAKIQKPGLDFNTMNSKNNIQR